MTCPSANCGAQSCYLCRAIIAPGSGYSHFCGIPHCDHRRCGNCIVYTATEYDEVLLVNEVRSRARQPAACAAV